MNSPALQDIVNAVLYEGYILYPYRASAKKNLRERFTFGRVYPEAYSAAQMGAEPCLCQTQCLATLITGPATLHVSVGFLQPVARRVGAVAPGQRLTQLPNEADLEWLPELRVDNEIFQAWHEAVEQQITIPPLLLGTESTATFEYPFCFPGTHRPEPIR